MGLQAYLWPLYAILINLCVKTFFKSSRIIQIALANAYIILSIAQARLWPPHVSLIKPFVRGEAFLDASQVLHHALQQVQPFSIKMRLDTFEHHTKCVTVWLVPDEESMPNVRGFREFLCFIHTHTHTLTRAHTTRIHRIACVTYLSAQLATDEKSIQIVCETASLKGKCGKKHFASAAICDRFLLYLTDALLQRNYVERSSRHVARHPSFLTSCHTVSALCSVSFNFNLFSKAGILLSCHCPTPKVAPQSLPFLKYYHCCKSQVLLLLQVFFKYHHRFRFFPVLSLPRVLSLLQVLLKYYHCFESFSSTVIASSLFEVLSLLEIFYNY